MHGQVSLQLQKISTLVYSVFICNVTAVFGHYEIDDSILFSMSMEINICG